MAQIAASIREFGWTNPILLNGERGIIAGHGRVMAARLLEQKQVPCIELGHLSPAQQRAYVIADNKLALNAGWDDALLRTELQQLTDANYDLSLTGLDAAEIKMLLAGAGTEGENPDELPAEGAREVSKPGDLWILGQHRLLCGDSTMADDAERALGGLKPHLMVTDPPYGVDYDPDWRNTAERAGALGRVTGARATGVVENDHRADWREAWSLFPGDVAYVWHGALHAAAVAETIAASGFVVRSQIIWAKGNLVIGRGDYHWQHEACWYAVRKGKTGHWQGDRTQSTLWEISHNQSETGHSTQKPVECMRRPMVNNSAAGDAVYDPFCGSGTSLIAAEMTARRCIAIEIAPRYVDVAIRRWQQFAKAEAFLEGDPLRSFSEVAASAENDPMESK